MKRFDDLYKELLEATIHNKEEEYIKDLDQYDTQQLDCLLHPKDHPIVWHTGNCECDDGQHCVQVCPFHAIHPGDSNEIIIDEDLCTGCAYCIQECKAKNITSSKDVIPALQSLRSHKGPTYALIAPAFLGQFDNNVSPGQLRSSLKKVGFDGMIEVALFADILTLKEALEFKENIKPNLTIN